MFDFLKDNLIKIRTVDLEKVKVRIPVAVLKGKKQDKMILVTAGMDGDEYCGIEAAYQLIKSYQKESYDFNIVVIPIVNTIGFFQGVSMSPVDGKFPKYIFPGDERGSSTERLINWLYKEFISKAYFWIDLHGGATGEFLEPFVWTYETKNQTINTKMLKIIKNISTNTVIYEKVKSYSKEQKLANCNVGYIILEAGQLGRLEKNCVNQHLIWLSKIFETFNQDAAESLKKDQRIYKKTQCLLAKDDGLWYPNLRIGKEIEIGQLIGTLVSFDGKSKRYIANSGGVTLWGKSNVSCKKGDILISLAADVRGLL